MLTGKSSNHLGSAIVQSIAIFGTNLARLAVFTLHQLISGTKSIYEFTYLMSLLVQYIHLPSILTQAIVESASYCRVLSYLPKLAP